MDSLSSTIQQLCFQSSFILSSFSTSLDFNLSKTAHKCGNMEDNGADNTNNNNTSAVAESALLSVPNLLVTSTRMQMEAVLSEEQRQMHASKPTVLGILIN